MPLLRNLEQIKIPPDTTKYELTVYTTAVYGRWRQMSDMSAFSEGELDKTLQEYHLNVYEIEYVHGSS